MTKQTHDSSQGGKKRQQGSSEDTATSHVSHEDATEVIDVASQTQIANSADIQETALLPTDEDSQARGNESLAGTDEHSQAPLAHEPEPQAATSAAAQELPPIFNKEAFKQRFADGVWKQQLHLRGTWRRVVAAAAAVFLVAGGASVAAHALGVFPPMPHGHEFSEGGHGPAHHKHGGKHGHHHDDEHFRECDDFSGDDPRGPGHKDHAPQSVVPGDRDQSQSGSEQGQSGMDRPQSQQTSDSSQSDNRESTPQSGSQRA